MAKSSNNVKETTRASREADTREKQSRRKPWWAPHPLKAIGIDGLEQRSADNLTQKTCQQDSVKDMNL